MPRRVGLRGLPVFGAVLVASLLTGVAPALGATRTSAPSPVVAPRVFGIAVPGAPGDFSALDQVTQAVGSAPTQVVFYSAWAAGGDFPAAGAAAIAARGAVPELVWEPWDPAAGAEQPAYSLAAIAGGAHDAYVTRWAKQMKGYAKPVVIRFAHEMNGGWYPWGQGVNGNSPASYVAAWRHVVDLFTRQKVTNVTWEWAPNVPSAQDVPLSRLYPGDGYVQRVALDGYNWGTTQWWSSWQSFADVFGAGVSQLRSFTTRPIYITETASTETGGDKAAWISDMWSWLAVHPEVRGITWFDFDKETDWRIDSSPAALEAFRRGIEGFLAS